MLFLWPQTTSMAHFHPSFGVITSPTAHTVPRGIQEGRRWACDNNAFTQGFKPERFFVYLQKLQEYQPNCLFVVCPDAVGDARRTLELYTQWSVQIRTLGYPVAFVAQDGQEELPFPAEFDWLFIGGSTEWKLGAGAEKCIRRAQAICKPVHVGRVNSISRFRRFQLLGVDSADGTNPIYEPNRSRVKFTMLVSQMILGGMNGSQRESQRTADLVLPPVG
jgi:hypothetical protein